MILSYGLPGDGPMARVCDALARFGYPATFLDQRITIDSSVEMSIDAHVAGVLRVDGCVVDLQSVTAAYLRPYDPRQFPDVMRAGPGSDKWNRAVLVEDMLASWADLSDALVINRPAAMVSNSSKPFQAMQIRSLGFEVPQTIVTTDPDEVVEFTKRHEKVIYKSISAVRSIVSKLTEEHLTRLSDICWCPTQFQEFVPGTDFRVHVVGEEVFASEIVSEADDYRYASQQGGSVDIRASSLPDEVANRCVALSRELGLGVSGVDLRRTPEGKWYCFEVNPSPAFSFYQSATGQRIDEAIARLLIKGSPVNPLLKSTKPPSDSGSRY
jgi:hypothetical protein